MLSLDVYKIKQLELDLKTFKGRAYPYATRQAVNQAAFKAQKVAQLRVRNEMILRNAFTARSIRVDRARELVVSRQMAVVGSVAPYMETQEFGGTVLKRGKHGKPIATGYAAGQEAQKPRTRLPKRANQLGVLQLKNRRKKGRGRLQQNLIAVKEAAATGAKFVYLDLGKRKGIFRVLGGKRRTYIKMVHDLSHKSVTVPRNQWLLPSAKEAQRSMPQYYLDALRYQTARHGLFR